MHDSGTFDNSKTPAKGTPIIPILEDNRVKILEDGSLDKLKNRLVVRGDIQKKMLDLLTWAPTASHHVLKLFLAYAAILQVQVDQLDFVGAFLQANMRSEVWVHLPYVFGTLFPEYKEYCGIPLLLVKSMYGQAVNGRYWYEELSEFLVKELGFTISTLAPTLY